MLELDLDMPFQGERNSNWGFLWYLPEDYMTKINVIYKCKHRCSSGKVVSWKAFFNVSKTLGSYSFIIKFFDDTDHCSGISSESNL